ncbi:MAG: hypothetical protein IEMM0008_1276 [bacterium]|nr:MAG: hypothetical protein IEMM0008_1276 [bacterium]
MKKKQDSKLQNVTVDDLAGEYDFDYQKARPNRFADKLKDQITVTLDPDVAMGEKNPVSGRGTGCLK